MTDIPQPATCDTCKNWRRYRTKDRRGNYPYGVCGRIAKGIKQGEEIIVASDEVLTGERFGCIHWEIPS